MQKTQIIFAILFGFIIFLGLLTSNPKILKRIEAHINQRLGIIEKAQNIKVTFPEGSTNKEMSEILSSKLQNFNKEIFLELTKNDEGYIFPDTYLFYPNQTAESVVTEMKKNFEKKVKKYLDEDSLYTDKQIIIMASILEEEGTINDMAIISGILWKRLSLSMPLQVDAAPITYERKGLPAVPISNPGIFAIKSAIYAEESPYLYYLHDKNGIIHLAKNYDEHKKNISKYLK